jgi:hypothetical protein
MKVKDLKQKDFLKQLFGWAAGKDMLMKNFKAPKQSSQQPEANSSQPIVLLRHDVDDDLDASVRMASLEMECGVVATYFILNTAPYWKKNDETMWEKIKKIEGMGHEIAWHNNLITEWILAHNWKEGYTFPAHEIDNDIMTRFINDTLAIFKKNKINVKGTASHGDKLCYKYGYINYEVFEECTRMDFDMGFAPKTITHPVVKMKDFGLKYEAYHLPRDKYYWKVLPTEADLQEGITQVLIHPQWWQI